jgi:hypothetical protein
MVQTQVIEQKYTIIGSSGAYSQFDNVPDTIAPLMAIPCLRT